MAGPEAGKEDGHAPEADPKLRAAPLWLLAVALLLLPLYLLLRDPPRPEASTESLAERPTPVVLVAVRDLSRLEGANFHMERVIELSSRQRHLFGLVEAEDALLLVAAGDVVAGVDLSELRPEDVVIDAERRTARLTLPRARIFSTRLDSERTFVHSRQTDLLARRRESLETEARRRAERSLREAALEQGILDRAERSVARTTESLVRSLGYREVVITFREAEGSTKGRGATPEARPEARPGAQP